MAQAMPDFTQDRTDTAGTAQIAFLCNHNYLGVFRSHRKRSVLARKATMCAGPEYIVTAQSGRAKAGQIPGTPWVALDMGIREVHHAEAVSSSNAGSAAQRQLGCV
jgi:hypothetical protein